MKHLTFLVLIVLILSACSAQPELVDIQNEAQNLVVPEPEVSSIPTRTSITADYLNTDYEDATSIRNQLTYGTLLLEDTEYAVTVDQARVLLPLYQAMLSLTGDTNSVSEEFNAVQNQIVGNMTQEQLEKIAQFQITNTFLNGFYLENG